jgi:hypothetical protein
MIGCVENNHDHEDLRAPYIRGTRSPTVSRSVTGESARHRCTPIKFEDPEILERVTRNVTELQNMPREIDRLQNPDRPFGRIEQIGTVLSSAAERIEAAVTPPPPRLVVDKKAQLSAFLWGLAIGMVIIFYLWHR